jgi:glycosyltransferase 2 family protein
VYTATTLAPTAPHTVRPGVPVARPIAQMVMPRASVRKTVIAWAKLLGGIGILAVLLWRVGTGPFLDGVRLIDAWALVAALAIGALTTVCCAWRWSLVSAGLGVRLPLGTAIVQCYRSVFLNSTLPGGVLGDVDRAVRQGKDAGNVGHGVHAVVWERTAGQVVQAVIAVIVLFAFPSPVQRHLPVAAAVAVVAGALVYVVLKVVPRRGPSRIARAFRSAAGDVRNGLLANGNWFGVLVASSVVVCGHLAMFVVAARTAGATAPLSMLVPLTLLALLAMGLPLSFAGFGPREGMAAWAFAAAGLTADQGVATAMVYGALALVSSLPGAAVLVARRLRFSGRRGGEGQLGG